MKLAKIIMIGIVATLSGCADAYKCGRFPDEKCKPVSAVYEETNNGVVDRRREFYTDGVCEDCDEGDLVKTTNRIPNKRGPAIGLIANGLPGAPILKQAEVRRILLNNWKDEEGDMHSGEFIFVKIGDDEWITSSK